MRVHADVHYSVVKDFRHEIKALSCLLCTKEHPFIVSRMEYRRGTDRSGLGRYNRMRAAIVKHLHSAHRDALFSVPVQKPSASGVNP